MDLYYGNLSFLSKYFKDDENWLLVFIDSARRGLGSNGKTIIGPSEEKLGPP
jgi:hypothetical protein